jgi:hypothetical protein
MPKVDLAAAKGTALPAEAVGGQVAAGVAKFFDVTTPAGTVNLIPTVATLTNAPADSAGVTILQRALVMHSTTIATLDLQSDFTLADGSADDDAYNGCLVVIRDSATATRRCMGFVKDYTGATRRVVLAIIPGVAGFVMEAGDFVDIIPCGAKAVWDELINNHAIGLSTGAVLTALSNYDIVHTGTAAAIDTVAGLWIQLVGTDSTGASIISGKYDGQIIFIMTGTDAGTQQRVISTYIVTESPPGTYTKKAYFNTPLAGTTWTAGTYVIKAGAYIPVPYIADAVLDELIAGHAAAGSAGKALTDILADTGTDGVVLTSAYDLYTAHIELTVDEANSKDEWTVIWFKNGARVTSGITVPTIQIVKRADGTDLIGAAAMTQIGTTGAYKYDATTTARSTAGEAVLAVVAATIDAASRSFAKVITRDSAAV